MYFDCDIYFVSFIFYLPFTLCLSNKYLKVTNNGVSDLSTASIGLQFFVDVSNLSDEEDFRVSVVPDKCCLKVDNGDVNCDILDIQGECNDDISKGSSKKFKLIAPTLDTLNRYGYCDVVMNSKPVDGHRIVMRDAIRIDFDTRLENAGTKAKLQENIKPCKHVDQNPLNDCKTVDCEVFYNGKRSFYDRKQKRCVQANNCVSDSTNEDIVYDPKSNACNGLISDDDLEFLKTITHRPTKDIVIISESQNDKKNISKKGQKPINHVAATPVVLSVYKDSAKPCRRFNFLQRLSRCINVSYCVLVAVVLTQCCLIFGLVYIFKFRKKKDKETKKFFNYRQDASVITPLIATSNVDTDTTDNNYFFDPSNNENKIKCYKACQKENDVTKSFSDDILSKCIKRRDWSSSPVKAHTIPDGNSKNRADIEKGDIDILLEDIKIDPKIHHTQRADINKRDVTKSQIKDKITVESDNPSKMKCSSSKLFSKLMKNSKSTISCAKSKISEKEILCHNYNLHANESTPITVHGSTKRINNSNKAKKEQSVENEAQVLFTNDSIDDLMTGRFLSIDGENFCEYSISSKSGFDELSGKTSKNNILRNVFSYISKHSGKPRSDPGKTSNSRLDIDILHFTGNESVCSSIDGDEYLNHDVRKKSSKDRNRFS